VSKGIGNMKETSETSENIRNMTELWKSKNQLIQIITDVYIKLVNDSSRM
jgi:hypothetical protein